MSTINPLEKLFTGAGIMKISTINHIPFRMLDLSSAYEIVLNDILNNRSKLICTYIGQ